MLFPVLLIIISLNSLLGHLLSVGISRELGASDGYVRWLPLFIL